MKNLHISTSPLTNRIYAGTVLKDGCTWGEGKTDVTGPACGAVAEHAIRNGGSVTVQCNGQPKFEICVHEIGQRQSTWGIYCASKVKHAPKWIKLRDAGIQICSTWIDEAGEDQTSDYAELSVRCITEIRHASAVLLYCEPGEFLKGALIEAGIALAAGIQVLCVGRCDSLSRVFREHPKWHEFDCIDDALNSLGKEGAA